VQRVRQTAEAHGAVGALDILVPVVPEMNMAYETILSETRGRIGLITFNRPKALNALNSQMIDEMNAALDVFQVDAAIAVIVITGSEKAFAAGADIREMKDKTYDEARAQNFLSNWDHSNTIRKPLIAAVSGYALGGGFEYALACDILIADGTAKFALPEVTIGVIPGGGGTQRLARTLGKAKAMELILTGRMIDAYEAERLGIVSALAPEGQALHHALMMAEKIAGFSQPVIAAAKEAVRAAFEQPMGQGLAHERALFHAMFALEDQKEGMAAFVDKRKAVFKDR
jgi:enoyl-CoA hydratase